MTSAHIEQASIGSEAGPAEHLLILDVQVDSKGVLVEAVKSRICDCDSSDSTNGSFSGEY